MQRALVVVAAMVVVVTLAFIVRGVQANNPDQDGDGFVTVADIFAVAGQFGQTAPPKAAGVSGLEIVQTVSANDSTSFKSQWATCPAGKNVVGGGASIDVGTTTTVALQGSKPGATTWEARAREISATAGNWRLRSYAICLDLTP